MKSLLVQARDDAQPFRPWVIRATVVGHWLIFACVCLQAVLMMHYASAYAPRVHSILLLQIHFLVHAASLAFVNAQHEGEDFIISSGMNMPRADSMMTKFFLLLTFSISAGAYAIAPLPLWAACVAWASPVVTLLTAPGISHAFRGTGGARVGIWGASLGLSSMVFAYQLGVLFGAAFGAAYALLGIATSGFNALLGRTSDQRVHLVETIMHVSWNAAFCVAIAMRA